MKETHYPAGSSNNNDESSKATKTKNTYLSRANIIAVVSTIVLVLVSFLLSFFLSRGVYVDYKSYASAQAIRDIKADYIVPGLSANQKSEILNQDSVDGIFDYFGTRSKVTINNREATVQTLFYEKEDGDSMTNFSSSRIIEEADVPVGKRAYVDEEVLSYFSASVGDGLELTLGSRVLEFNIYALAGNDYIDGKGTVAFILDDALRNILTEEVFTGRAFSYNKTYVDTNNSQAFYDYIRTYKPENERKSREEFPSDVEYQAYLESFNSQDYSANIIATEALKNSGENDITRTLSAYQTNNALSILYLSLGVLSTMVVIVVGYYFFVLLGYKNNNQDSKPLIKREVLLGIPQLILSFLSIFLGYVFSLAGVLSFSLAFPILIVPSLIGLGINFLGLAIMLWITKRKMKG